MFRVHWRTYRLLVFLLAVLVSLALTGCPGDDGGGGGGGLY